MVLTLRNPNLHGVLFLEKGNYIPAEKGVNGGVETRQCGEPVDKNELDHAEPAEPTSNNAIEQMVLDEEDSPPS